MCVSYRWYADNLCNVCAWCYVNIYLIDSVRAASYHIFSHTQTTHRPQKATHIINIQHTTDNGKQTCGISLSLDTIYCRISRLVVLCSYILSKKKRFDAYVKWVCDNTTPNAIISTRWWSSLSSYIYSDVCLRVYWWIYVYVVYMITTRLILGKLQTPKIPKHDIEIQILFQSILTTTPISWFDIVCIFAMK